MRRVQQNNLKAEFVRDAKDRGLGIMAWTVNSVEEMEMVMMKGVDAIVTDHPERIPAVAAKVNEEQEACIYTDGNTDYVTDGRTYRIY